MSARESELEHADSLNVPQDINTHLLSATPYAGDGAGVVGSLRETGSCPCVEGAVGGVTSVAHSTLFNAPLEGTLLVNH